MAAPSPVDSVPGDKSERQARRQRGRLAELAAAWWLRLKLYRVLARNFRTNLGEIDIVARRGHTLVAVEVKARHAHAADAIGPTQRGRIQRALLQFQAARPELAGCRLRFDAVLVERSFRLRHIVDAWRP
jgi:putative endonuclease